MALDIDQISGTLEITDALARYCRALDRLDDELALTLWHAGGTVDYGAGLFTGSAVDFVKWLRPVHEGVDATTHRIANAIVRVTGETAVSEAYGHVMLITRTPGGQRVQHTFGRYLDRWSLRGGTWAIDHRRYVRDAGWVATDEALPGSGRRDGTDPSYELLGSLRG